MEHRRPIVALVPCVEREIAAPVVNRLAMAYSRVLGFCVVMASSGRSAAETIEQAGRLEPCELEGWLDVNGTGVGSVQLDPSVTRERIVGALQRAVRGFLVVDDAGSLLRTAHRVVLIASSCQQSAEKALRIMGSAAEQCVGNERLCALVDVDGVHGVAADLERRWGIAVRVADDEGCRVVAEMDLMPVGAPRTHACDPRVYALKRRIIDGLADDAELKQVAAQHAPMSEGEMEERTRRAVAKLMAKVSGSDLKGLDRRLLVEEVVDEAVGLGPIEKLIDDPAITEVMVNGCRAIYVERDGVLEDAGIRFSSDEQVARVIERIVAPLGRRVDERRPFVDARLPDGSRVNAIIPPLALDGPVLTIRRFSPQVKSMGALVHGNALTNGMADFLAACVRARINIVVSGGTGAGKTTLLNALSSFIGDRERIITIEDAAELDLDKPHVVRLESRPPNLEDAGGVTIRDLVRNALRMRPDRIIVGECRGGEALDMLQAMNTGHDGSLTTVHANNPRDALSRLETMVLFGGVDLPLKAIREQISSALDVIVQLERLSDGCRRVVQIAEVGGMEGDVITTQELLRYHRTGRDGRSAESFEATGFLPRFAERCAQRGIFLPRMG